jgi:hypothetical protein
MTQYGMGELSALITLCELGDVSRMHASRQAVRIGRDRHRRAPLGPHQPPGEAHPPRIRGAALGARRSRAIRVPAREPRVRRLRRTEGARALIHLRVAHDRPQARPALRPPAPRTRPRRPRTHRALTHPAPPPTHHRCVPSFRLAPEAIEAPAPGRQPTKDRAAGVTPQERPINHLVTGSRAWQPRTQIRQGVQEQPEPNPTNQDDDHLTALDDRAQFR